MFGLGSGNRWRGILYAFRQRRDIVTNRTSLSLNELLHQARFERHGVALGRRDWREHSHSLAFTLRSLRKRFLIHAMINVFWEPLTFELPPVPAESGQRWRRAVDTALASPDDFYPLENAPLVDEASDLVQDRSLVFLVRATPGKAQS